jgi:hypothetical protein
MTKVLRKKNGKLVLCVENDGYEASLEIRKIYVTVRDPEAQDHKQLRVVDESGEDYLYPASFFRTIQLPRSLRRAVLSTV